MTEKFYYHNPYTAKIVATVLDVREKDGERWVLTDQTVFYPGGGGQLPDRGLIEKQTVTDVKEKNGKIWHKLQKDAAQFTPGQKVTMEIDWPYRFYQMQQHTGQHLLSAVLERAGWPTVSVHLGEAHTLIEVEGRLPETAELHNLEKQAQTMIAHALAVKTHWVTADDMDRFPLRRPPAKFDNLRVVEIEHLDYSACGGTHLQNTAEIGLIKIVGCEKIRGRARIKALIGERAFEYMEQLHQTSVLLREKLNTDHLQFNERVAQLQEELHYLKRLKKFYQQYFVNFTSRELAESTNDALVVFKMEQGEQDDAAAIAKKLSQTYHKVALIQFDRRFFLTSPSAERFDTIKFIKENAEHLEIRGGGPQGYCQGVMKRNNLKQIAETVNMALKSI
ncbi:alanyl-tRNA editing protein [Calditrichota bacterium GD2]